MTETKETREESKRVLERYPDKVPIIVDIAKDCSLKPLDKNKYIVPNDMTMGQFLYVIRKKIEIKSGDAIFIFCNKCLVKNSDTLLSVYNINKHENGFLYFTVSTESTFG